MEKETGLKKHRKISIVIDDWDDVFSDFDPRPLNERLLSEDFVSELKKRYRETRTGRFTITIRAPTSLRDDEAEKMVRQRITRDFMQKYLQKTKEIYGLRARGVMFVSLGILSLAALTTITYFKVFRDIIIELLAIVLMPLGWFGIWEGFSKIVDASPIHIQEQKFFEKFSRAEYEFEYVDE